jgi:tetratricopeptide (TPR) repeat protein
MSQVEENRQEENDGNKEARGVLERLGRQSQLDFEVAFFDRILDKKPDYVDVLRVQANNLATKGLHARGLDVDRRLVRLRPEDPLAHYNLACSYALLTMTDAALAALEESLRLGYRDFEHLLRDPDMEQVRSDKRFVGLLRSYLKKMGQSRRSR